MSLEWSVRPQVRAKFLLQDRQRDGRKPVRYIYPAAHTTRAGSVINKNSDWGGTCLPETAFCLRVAIFLTIFVVFSFAGICDKNDDGAAL